MAGTTEPAPIVALSPLGEVLQVALLNHLLPELDELHRRMEHLDGLHPGDHDGQWSALWEVQEALAPLLAKLEAGPKRDVGEPVPDPYSA